MTSRTIKMVHAKHAAAIFNPHGSEGQAPTHQLGSDFPQLFPKKSKKIKKKRKKTNSKTTKTSKDMQKNTKKRTKFTPKSTNYELPTMNYLKNKPNFTQLAAVSKISPRTEVRRVKTHEVCCKNKPNPTAQSTNYELPTMNFIKTNPILILITLLATTSFAANRDYSFDTQISRPVLENYLSRSITMSELLHGRGDVDDNIRMLNNTGAKFIGRAIYRWGSEAGLEKLLATAKPIAAKLHKTDPEIIIQAAAFEIVTTQVNQIPIPDRIFKEFALTPEKRNFSYEAMLYPNNHRVNHWHKGASVPDMSQIETRMWFTYLAARYIDIGVEAIHFGQVEIMDDRDSDHKHWRDMMNKTRQYARKYARRHMLICDAHVPSGGIVHNNKLMFDFHSFPLRIEEVEDPKNPGHGILKIGYLDSLFQRSKGGITPSGWKCKSLPYIAELDNFGRSGKGGQNIGAHWIWGYDEICWFAHQPEEYRNQWLHYAWKWIRQNDPNGYLQMPGSRTLADPVGNLHWYYANTKSPKTPTGFNQEETIKKIWLQNNH